MATEPVASPSSEHRTAKLPSIVIAGAAKCGTTALAEALGAHRQIVLGAEKEPRFFCGLSPDFVGPDSRGFNERMITTAEAYEANFADPGDRHTLDASTDYLAHPDSAIRIAAANPQAKIIIGLRHPVARAYSEHTHLLRDGLEPETFERSLELESTRRADGWVPLFWHVGRSTYAPGLAAFLEAFGREQVFVYLHEDYVSNPSAILADITTFLELDTPLVPAGVHNASGVPRNRLLNALIRPQRFDFLLKFARRMVRSEALRKRIRGKIDDANLDRPDAVSAAAAETIIDAVRADSDACEKLLDRDLHHWRLPPA